MHILLPPPPPYKKVKLVPYQRCALFHAFATSCVLLGVTASTICLGNAHRREGAGIGTTAEAGMGDFSKQRIARHQTLNSPALLNYLLLSSSQVAASGQSLQDEEHLFPSLNFFYSLPKTPT